MDYELIQTERRGEVDGILWLTLNRPSRLNALTMPMLAELLDAFQAARKDRSVRCIVITGAGRGFCAGMDFSGTGGGPPTPEPLDLEGHRLYFRNESETFIALRRRRVRPG